MRLNRKISHSGFQKLTSFESFDTCLHDYHSQAIRDFCTGTYSKLGAIRKLTNSTLKRCEALEVVRALLTDRGLLFPQTRERYYLEPRHSLNRHEQSSGFYRQGLQNMGVDENTGYAERIHQFARQVWEERNPSISYDRIVQALAAMLDDDPEGRLPEIVAGVDAGYCKSELGQLEQSAEEQDLPVDPAAAEAIMEPWLQTVQLKFSSLEAVPAYDYLREKQNFTVTESFEFLSDVLDRCRNKEEQYQICCSQLQPYEPVLATEHKEAWEQQLARFWQEDLSQWREALPALGEYLHLDTQRFAGTTSLDGIPDPRNSEFENRLYAAFHDYLCRMEPGRTLAQPHSKCKKDESKLVKDKTLAILFVNAVYIVDEAAPLFMDLPSVIFHLFRSPVFRHIHNLDDRNWSLVQTVKYACIDFPLPITFQSLDADEKLYFAIVDVCEAYCKAWNVPFNASPWRALWECIRQSVLCLSFQKADLFTARYCFRNLLWYSSFGYPLLDMVLSDKMEAEDSSAYIGLWRMLVSQAYVGKKPTAKSQVSSAHKPAPKNCKDGIRIRRLKELQANVDYYRSLFEDVHENLDQVVACILQVLKNSKSNRIAFLPKRDEWAEFFSRLQSNITSDCRLQKLERKQKKLSAHTITSSRDDDNRPDTDEEAVTHRTRTIELILAEWLLLQWNCQTARRELMSALEKLLTE